MATFSYMPDKGGSSEFDPSKTKQQRAQDAEKIRQDFIKSQRLPVDPASATKKPPTEAVEDEY